MVSAAGEDDALLPWLRSIRQIKQSFPNDKAKAFPLVADCFKQFQDDERYCDDIRFLKICIQYADCSPDPLKVIAELDEKGVGQDHALFYEAYATCLEAKRRFGDANTIYKRGISRQAQPVEKLINSYKLFRDRMESRKKRKQDQLDNNMQKTHPDENPSKEEACANQRHLVTGGDDSKQMVDVQHGGVESVSRVHLLSLDWYTPEGLDLSFEELRLANMCKKTGSSVGKVMENSYVSSSNHLIDQISDKPMGGSFGDETIQIRNFAAKAITGKEKDVEDAQHHGLVDPTVNTKEAIQYILSMFREPMDIGKKKETGKSAENQVLFSSSPVPNTKVQSFQSQPFEFSVFNDSDCPSELGNSSGRNEEPPFVIFNDERADDVLVRSGKGEQESGFFVYKDDEPVEAEQAFGVYRDEETFEGVLKGKVLVEKRNDENSEIAVFRDEEPEAKRVQAEGKTSKSKSFGMNKTFPIGAENILPQSPLY